MAVLLIARKHVARQYSRPMRGPRSRMAFSCDRLLSDISGRDVGWMISTLNESFCGATSRGVRMDEFVYVSSGKCALGAFSGAVGFDTNRLIALPARRFSSHVAPINTLTITAVINRQSVAFSYKA